MDTDLHDILTQMTNEEIDRVAKQMALAGKLFGIVKGLAAALAACVMGLATIAFWARDTSAAISTTRADIQQIIGDRKEKLKEWDQWKSQKNEIDTQMTLLLTNQQRMIDRQQTVLDRIELRLNSTR